MNARGVPQRKEFCIKDNLYNSLKLNPAHQNLQDYGQKINFYNLIHERVNRARDITLRVSMLDSLYTLQACEAAAQEQEAQIFNHNQQYYYKLAQIVCRSIVLEPDDPMPPSLNQFYGIYPGGENEENLLINNLTAMLSEIAVSMQQNFNEHVSRNLQPIFIRLLQAEMLRAPNFLDHDQEIRKNYLYMCLSCCQIKEPTGLLQSQLLVLSSRVEVR